MSPSDPALQLSAKPSLFCRVTSKLNISILLKSRSDASRSRPSTRTLAADTKRSRRVTIPASQTLPNGFFSKEHREAALRERGLLPPRKDLSQQEREADEHISPTRPPDSTFRGSTEAEQLKASWLVMNRTSESGDSDRGSPPPPYLQGTELGPQSMTSSGFPHADVPSNLPCTRKPSIRPPQIVSSPLDDTSSPILAESPVSYDSSSHSPGSTLESQSQSDHFPVPVREKENPRSRVVRRCTSDTCERPLKAVGISLPRLGTRSLSSLRRRSTAEFSLGRASTRTSSSAGLPPRTAVSPTMHSLGSIIREAKHIEDAESRRLCELAFLD